MIYGPAQKTARRVSGSTRARSVHSGYTLVELMVALTISLLILAALSQVFITSRVTYTLEEGLARSQEAGRFAIEFLTQDIRMAGYTGCSSQFTPGTIAGGSCGQNTVCNLVSGSTVATSFNPVGLRGHRHNGGSGTALTDWTPALPGAYFIAGEVKAKTDVIVIQRASYEGTTLTGNTTPSNANVVIRGAASLASQIKAGDILMVASCTGADVFKTDQDACSGSCPSTVTITHPTATNTQAQLTHAYGNDAELMKLVSNAYYVGTGASGEPALFRKELVAVAGTSTPTARELVEGIDGMDLTYGEDTDANGIPDLFRTADLVVPVTNWANVSAVRVLLQARTPSKVGQQVINKSISFDGFAVNPLQDQYQRQFFTTTIQLRN